ncbi:MAG TPA: TonB family protein [Bradyrhizobium sp.]|nr:TonB family protein [Bradyrhizobium sp.]
MTALALHLPQYRSFPRWAFAALTVLFIHAMLASIALWQTRQAIEPTILPAIAVSLLPTQSSSPDLQDQDIAVGPAMQEAEETRQHLIEEEKPPEKLEPLPPAQAEVALPKIQEKEIETPRPVVQPPAPETRAPPKTEHIGQFSEAADKAYNALVFGHLQRFKRYPATARGASGVVVVRFELNRAGEVIESAVTKSSGHAVLDQEALTLLKRASPFPPFPPTKPGERDSYTAPVNFSR